MKHTLFSLFIFCFSAVFMSACESEHKAAPIDQIPNRLSKQSELWNKGDIEGYMKTYENSDSLSFASKHGISYGWETVLSNYKRGYPDRAAMGQLKFELIDIKAIESTHALVLGKWSLTKEDNSNPSGYFTLIMEYTDGEWFIISDHTSG